MDISLKRLVDDHINLSYILVLAEKRLQHSETPEQLLSTLPFLCSCMDYLCDYPQQFHHPIENLLIEFIIANNKGTDQLAIELKKDHQQLETNAEQLREQLHRANEQHNVQMLSAIKAPLLQCLHEQLKHITDEEQQLLPLIDKFMTPEHWQLFNQQLNQQQHFNDVSERRQDFVSTLDTLISLGRNGGINRELWQSF